MSDLEKQVESIRIALNDMAATVAVHRAAFRHREKLPEDDALGGALLALLREIENLKARPVWDESRIQILENAKDPQLEAVWAAVRGLQNSTPDKGDMADLMMAVARLERKLQPPE